MKFYRQTHVTVFYAISVLIVVMRIVEFALYAALVHAMKYSIDLDYVLRLFEW